MNKFINDTSYCPLNIMNFDIVILNSDTFIPINFRLTVDDIKYLTNV